MFGLPLYLNSLYPTDLGDGNPKIFHAWHFIGDHGLVNCQLSLKFVQIGVQTV